MTARTRSTSFFDRLALAYDQRGLQRFAYRPTHDAVIAQLDGVRPSRIVDLGCGTGQLTRRLIERFPDATVVAVDLSPGMLARAADRLDPLGSESPAIMRADAQRLPFAPASIDTVVCTDAAGFEVESQRRLARFGAGGWTVLTTARRRRRRNTTDADAVPHQ